MTLLTIMVQVRILTKVPSEAYFTHGEMFTSQGLLFETHKIITEDGYINTAWRVPGLLKDSPEELKNRKPVILQHGLFDNAGTWVVAHSDD